MSTVLVTGTGGFVGGAIAKRLVSDGHKVVGVWRDKPAGLVRLGVAAEDFATQAKMIMAFGDVRDRDFMYHLLVNYAPNFVIHQAAQSIVGKCHDDPWTAYSVNIMGMVSLLDACRLRHRDKPLSKIIVCTTDKVYADGQVPYVETQPLQAKGTYSTSKVAADFIARDYAETYGLPIVVVRSSNIFGPGDRDETRLIPGNILRLLRGEPAVLYEAALKMEREFVYIDDEVEAYMMLLRADVGSYPAVYNVGGSGPVPIAHIIEALVGLCGGRYELRPSGFSEISRQWMDASKLKALGWDQQVGLAEGLRRTVEWFKDWVSYSVYAG